eukprot:CAMPEP_0194120622 /NCGR_PEP_ID=MMETSP0150-20130528/44067_1 /TAXON_ID=122233 /ORGANISM="Chaetoceros debilis, Strain MM31A-1" /LENGTH=33 /DNA_ID= /DNA_START= /DNA_END= /DNA_ORIENTATION=
MAKSNKSRSALCAASLARLGSRSPAAMTDQVWS